MHAPTGVAVEQWELVLKYTAVDASQYRADRYDYDDFPLWFITHPRRREQGMPAQTGNNAVSTHDGK
ncbi:MAG: hypothetical protein F4Y63_11325 [Chloroflexi bacterium]|nr:hypothetical protein [Chloroflexota bacterium]MYK60372.1 hypothetical protein [Chloroflexota bacterium]